MEQIVRSLRAGRRLLLVAGLLVAGSALVIQATMANPMEKKGFVLVSDQDISVWDKENEELGITQEVPDFLGEDKFTAVEGAPEIIIVNPGVTGDELEELVSPIDFITKFQPQEGAEIDLDSIEVHYKWLGWKDVTDRILEHATVSAEGIEAIGAEIPKGKHKMRLTVKDTLGRESRERISFRVVSEP